MTKVISIVSGKGGSGKSLLTAVLGRALAREGVKVLLVDTDIFVRGLTVLLHNFSRKKTNDGITVSDLLGIYEKDSKLKSAKDSTNNYLIERFFECDLLPAVDSISSPLDYDDVSLSNESFVIEQLKKLLQNVADRYDYILLDNRAGLDSLIIASCKLSDIILSIAEDDDVGRQTNLNLVNYLKFSKGLKTVYTIINKARKVSSFEEIKMRLETRSDFSLLGIIPFDMDVLENFGTEKFWITINETLYFRSLLEAWNNLARTADVIEVRLSKYRFPPSIFMKRSQGKYTLIERVLRLYSLIAILTGIGMYAYYELSLRKMSNSSLISLLLILAGIFMLVLSSSNFLRLFIPFKNLNKADQYESEKRA